jgi:dihydrolipoamide dehydrogenase
MYDLFVIGAGPGGYEAAAHAGRMGKKVAIAEKQYIGGTCLNVGCIPTKTYLRSSKLLAECKNGAAFAVRIPSATLDLPALIERKNRVVGTLIKGVETLLKRTGVEVIRGHARLASRSTVLVGETSYPAKNILVASGSRPAVPPIPGIDSSAVLDSTSVFGLTEVPKQLAIIGGGYIGLEFASFFSAAGTEVVVFEMLPQIAAGCDRDIADRLFKELKRQGIQFRTGTRVTRIEGRTLHFEDAAGAAGTFAADFILNSTGRVPILEDLGLEQTGVDFDRNGIKTSDQGKTNVPGIWACGDVTGRRLLAHAAAREGIVAVNNMFGGDDRLRYDSIPSVIYTHPEVASVGKTEQELVAEGVAYKKSVVPMAYSGRFIIENPQGAGVVKVLVGAKYGELLGVHALGDSSSEFIIAAAAMIEAEMCVSDVAQLVFPHPTVSEAMKEAILRAAE